jgi:predicted amidohydrolase YtcJ
MTLIKNATIGTRTADVRAGELIESIEPTLGPNVGETVIDAHGGELTPGFHDHHLHFMATAAAMRSVQCGPPDVTTRDALAQVLAEAADMTDSDAWIRGIGYHESVAGNLDRVDLDALSPRRALRLQHRSGKLWVLNSLACERLEVGRSVDLDGVEADASGRPTGRLWRMDAWLRARIEGEQTFEGLSAQMTRLGITGFTDASFTNSAETVDQFLDARRAGRLEQRFDLMGDASLLHGPRKIMLDEDALPPLDSLVRTVGDAHAAGRSVAFHCVSHVELLFALTALGELPKYPGDRIEHAAIVRDDVLQALVDAEVTVVTQPGFLLERGDQYLLDVPADDIECLYRHKTLMDAGVPVVVSSDAPYGPLDPLLIARSAEARRSRHGSVIGAGECVSRRDALASYFLRNPCDPSSARSIEVGQPGDLCVLSQPLSRWASDTCVTATLIAGRLAYDSSA